MPRRREGGERGKGRGGGGSRGASFLTINHAHLDGWQGKGVSSKSHFSLSEEARNTERHHSWNSDLKLRHSRVAFVSAGASKAEDLTQILQEQAEERSEELQDSAKGTRGDLAEAFGKQSTSPPPIVVPEIPMSSMSLSDACGVNLGSVAHDPINVEIMREKGSEKETAKSDDFFTDVNGSGKTYTGLATPTVRRSPSFAASDSSEEIILFAGRKASQTQAHKKLDISRKSGAQPLSERTKPTPRTTTTVFKDLVGINLDGAISIPEVSSQRLPIAAHIAESLPFVEENVGPDRRKRRRRKGEKRSKKAKDDDAEIFADYIANTRDSQEIGTFAGSSAYNRRDLGGSDDQWQDDEEASVVEKQVDNADIDAIEWDSADLQDFDELSTSSEALTSIEQILSKRERISGVQYLVVGEGYTVDDARWLPISLLHISGADEQIQLFEEEQAEHERLFEGSENSEDSLKRDGNVAMDLHDDLDDLEDEHDLEERGKDRMTDEQIARLLAKQEELGLGSSDLLLFDGEDFADDRMGEIPLDGTLVRNFQPQPRPKRNNRYQNTFPSANKFTDVLQQDPYNGFDVMDQERPSLRKRPKGRRGKFTPALSDSEFEQSITITWENDRTKKRIRKQEREESRVQGLLGKKDKVDMKAKYAEGMSMDEVKCEIREFLLSSMESMPLPPMAQKERKIVHEIANVFKLKSKSIGAGKFRFPVLYRTARTIQYDEKTLNTIEATLSSKRFLLRSDKTQKRGVPARKARGIFASAGVSYRDGEVVGATAPELGQENRGRAMLEKMGWSTGTALGALNNNRGIVQPVTQVVKTGKAGLG